jgi:uncharacterized membrane protein YsdA (DUF1294 family)
MPGSVIIPVFYAVLNGIVFFLYAIDKRAAQKNTGRMREDHLLLFALIGPFGAYIAMKVFRHKTRKLKFYLVPVCAVLHICLLVWLVISYAK